MSWELEDCIIKDVDKHKKWEVNSIYVIGGVGPKIMKSIVEKQDGQKEKYNEVVGKDRWETLDKAIRIISR